MEFKSKQLLNGVIRSNLGEGKTLEISNVKRGPLGFDGGGLVTASISINGRAAPLIEFDDGRFLDDSESSGWDAGYMKKLDDLLYSECGLDAVAVRELIYDELGALVRENASRPVKAARDPYESPDVLRNILAQLQGRKFKLDCGHLVTLGHQFGNYLTIYNNVPRKMRIICSQCGY